MPPRKHAVEDASPQSLWTSCHAPVTVPGTSFQAGLARGTILGVGSRIVTERLVLEPLSQETAQASSTAAGRAQRGEGWPHADTLDALGMVAKHGSEAWLILENGVVVGDAGHARAARREPRRRDRLRARRAGSRPRARVRVRAGARAGVLARPEVGRVVAREVLADNVPSRRALERAGFRARSARRHGRAGGPAYARPAIRRHFRNGAWHHFGCARSTVLRARGGRRAARSRRGGLEAEPRQDRRTCAPACTTRSGVPRSTACSQRARTSAR